MSHWRVALILAMILPSQAFSQEQVEFRGRVLDTLNGQPLVGAVVRLPGLQRFTMTLRETANIVIRECSYAEHRRNGRTLCVDAPFIAANTSMQSLQLRQWTMFPSTSFGSTTRRNLSAMSRTTKTSPLRQGGRVPRLRPSPSRPVPVYVDDVLIRGSFDSLTTRLALRDVYRVESFGARGAEQIRFYTLDYISAISVGQLRAPTDITLPGDRFDDWLWREPDWLRDRVRRNRN